MEISYQSNPSFPGKQQCLHGAPMLEQEQEPAQGGHSWGGVGWLRSWPAWETWDLSAL